MISFTIWKPKDPTGSSRGQFLVLHRISLYEPNKRVPKEKVVLAVVVPPLLLVEVSRKMLHGNFVIGPDDAPIEQRPDALDRVGVDLPVYPLALGLVDRLMLDASGLGRELVGCELVGVESIRVPGNVLPNELPDLVSLPIAGVLKPDLTPALDGPENDRLALRTSAVPALPAQKGFVRLDDALWRWRQLHYCHFWGATRLKFPGRKLCLS